ncbi:hypothetical protein HAX54_035232 [Datura stramonium]|uniref:Uncharacterized protein n=1 Tax=Datura stramonium TaxID=4076 RepID=A0ABS8SF51_DATST|nr:hypothetical protein [Datura stramonium]
MRQRTCQQQAPALQSEEGGDASTTTGASESDNKSVSGSGDETSLGTKDNSAADTSFFERSRMHVVNEIKKQDDTSKRRQLNWLASVLTDREPTWLRDDTIAITKGGTLFEDQLNESVDMLAPIGDGAATPSEPPSVEAGPTTILKAALTTVVARPPVSALAYTHTRENLVSLARHTKRNERQFDLLL